MNAEDTVAIELHKFSILMKKCYEETANLQEGVVSVDKFNKRLRQIKEANSLLRCIVKFAEEINEMKNKLLDACSKDIMAINKLDVMKRNIEPIIFPVTRVPTFQHDSQLSKWETVISKKPKKTMCTTKKKVHITENTFVFAEEIPNTSKIISPGVLYYIPQKKLFAILICDNIFYGNMGCIYNKSGDFHRVKECDHYYESCSRSCTYFHDPLKVDWSSDIMNFTSNSFIYMPNQTGKVYYRRIGSRDSLEYDINLTGLSDGIHLGRQLMHELICWLVLANHQRNKKMS